MSVSIKSAHEIELMRESCRRLSIVHKELEEAIRPGISTLDIDRLGEKLIRSLGGIPNFLHYNGYALISRLSYHYSRILSRNPYQQKDKHLHVSYAILF